MKYRSIVMLVIAVIGLQLSGCSSNTNKSKKKRVPPIMPSGYTERTGMINETPTRPRALPIATFSSPTDGNESKNLIDGDINTRWSSRGKGTWAVIDYGQSLYFNAVRIAFTKGNERSCNFEIYTSEDGENWNQVIRDGVSSGITLDYERFPFTETKARYIKYVGQGNFYNVWSSATEINAVDCNVNECPADELIGIGKIMEVNRKRYK